MKFVKKASGIALAAMLAAGLTAGCGGGGGEKKAADAGKEIVVGVNAELTGNVANYGKSMLSGFELAVEEANKAGGVDGKQIKVVTADNKSEPSESGNAATKLVTQNKVVAVIGPATSGCVAAEEPVLTANKIPLIAPCATAPGITLQKDGKTKPFVFRACFIDPYQGDIMAQFAAKDLKVKKAAILHDSSSDYSKGLAEVFTKVFTANGGQITTDEAFLAKDVDFKASLTNAYTAEDKDPVVQKFVKAYQGKFNKVPDVFAMQGYNAGLILFNAIKTAKTTDGTKLAEAIAKTKDLQVANGKLTYDEKHNPITTALVLELKDGKMTLNKKIGG